MRKKYLMRETIERDFKQVDIVFFERSTLIHKKRYVYAQSNEKVVEKLFGLLDSPAPSYEGAGSLEESCYC